MKKHIWANPTTEWEGFRFAAYSLDSEKVWALPLTRKCPKNEKIEQIRTTVGEILANLADQRFEVDQSYRLKRFGVGVTIENEELEFNGPSFNYNVLKELLQLKKDGVEPFSALWFWYDSDSCLDDPHERYSFFVVYDDKIVRERISFSDYDESGFDPAIFKSEDSGWIWLNDSDWWEATTRFWYRKFYGETRTGQLMVLRPDEPILYHYERTLFRDIVGGEESVTQHQETKTRDIVREAQSVTLSRTYRLLLVALPLLAAIAFPSIKNYMGAAAIVLGVDFFWICWDTRTK